MWLVAIAWIYVVGLMALTEPSIVAGIMTFLGYCVLPLSIVWYIAGSKMRRMKIAQKEEMARRLRAGRQQEQDVTGEREQHRSSRDRDGDGDGGDSGGGDGGGD